MNPFEFYSENLSSPIDEAVAVTPSDTEDLDRFARCIYVGTTGSLTVTMARGGTVTFENVGPGFLPIVVSRVWATGTDVTGIIAGY